MPKTARTRRVHALSPDLLSAIAPLELTLAQYGGGTPNVLDVRKAQLASASAVRGALLDTKEASAQFVASAEHIFADVQKDARAQSDYFRGPHIQIFAAFHRIVLALHSRGLCRIFLYQSLDHPAAAQSEPEHARLRLRPHGSA